MVKAENNNKPLQTFIFDSDFLVALYRPDDASHQKAKSILEKLNKAENKFSAINLVLQESATVISHKLGMEPVRKFYKNILDLLDEVIEVDGNLEKQSWQIFLEQTKKGTSFVDCANLAVLRKYHLSSILSFDHFYRGRL